VELTDNQGQTITNAEDVTIRPDLRVKRREEISTCEQWQCEGDRARWGAAESYPSLCHASLVNVPENLHRAIPGSSAFGGTPPLPTSLTCRLLTSWND
jgi:hypothetical protein